MIKGLQMKRRKAIKVIMTVLGAAISPSVLKALEQPLSSETFKVSFPAFDLLSAMAERIIPTTDTPGAIDAGVPRFIQEILQQWYTEAERSIFVEGCVRANILSQKKFTLNFIELENQQQDLILTQLEVEAGPPNLAMGISLDVNLDEDLSPFFHKLKELVVVGYYTSEIGATQELLYDPMPMTYKGDIPLADIGRSWSGNGFL